MPRPLHLTAEERMLVQGLHAREQQLRPLIDQLNDDRDYVVAKIAERFETPVDRLQFYGPLGTVLLLDETTGDADTAPREDDRT